jgi:hypothetical protein
VKQVSSSPSQLRTVFNAILAELESLMSVAGHTKNMHTEKGEKLMAPNHSRSAYIFFLKEQWPK